MTCVNTHCKVHIRILRRLVFFILSRRSVLLHSPNVRHWLNIHIDYSQSTWLDIPNLVARIGGPWEAAENADVNVSCPPDMTHAWAWGMFERYGEKVLRERAEGWK